MWIKYSTWFRHDTEFQNNLSMTFYLPLYFYNVADFKLSILAPKPVQPTVKWIEFNPFYLPRQVKTFEMAGGQVKTKVCLPYMTGKISSCNFRDTNTQWKYNNFLAVHL